MRQTAREHEGPWPGMFGGVFAATLIFSPRIISLPFLLLALVVARRRPRARFVKFCAWGFFFLSLLSPVDLEVPGIGYPGMLRGNPRSGVRLVRVIVGMPAHTALVRHYGEYYSAGWATGYFSRSGFWRCGDCQWSVVSSNGPGRPACWRYSGGVNNPPEVAFMGE